MAADSLRVFVSYAHESAEHKDQVLALATFLREVGIPAVLDLWSADTRRDWYAWAIREMTEADFVLVVASERYRRSGDGNGPYVEHRGVQSEATLLRELVYSDRAGWLPKILPVVLPGHGIDQIPLFLQPNTASHYVLTSFTTAGAEELLRVILRQPGHIAPEVRPGRPVLPPHSGGPSDASDQTWPAQQSHVVNQINGTVSDKIVQIDTVQGDAYF
jgi:hypothetical protein